jgi:hypothetical protein
MSTQPHQQEQEQQQEQKSVAPTSRHTRYKFGVGGDVFERMEALVAH